MKDRVKVELNSNLNCGSTSAAFKQKASGTSGAKDWYHEQCIRRWAEARRTADWREAWHDDEVPGCRGADEEVGRLELGNVDSKLHIPGAWHLRWMVEGLLMLLGGLMYQRASILVLALRKVSLAESQKFWCSEAGVLWWLAMCWLQSVAQRRTVQSSFHMIPHWHQWKWAWIKDKAMFP